MAELLSKLMFKDSKRGYVKVEDGSVIVLRAAIIDVIPRETPPFGTEFDVNFTVGISVRPSENVVREVSDKPLISPGTMPNEGWNLVKITEKGLAYEEAIYVNEKSEKYILRVEIEPLMVSKNSSYKTLGGSPLYAVRWTPKVSWTISSGDKT
ncbi:MAG: hypothetical protein QXV69_06625 [Sulfolobaceae archaeon]